MHKFWFILAFLFSYFVQAANCPDFYCQKYLSGSLITNSDAREFENNHKVIDEIKTVDYGVSIGAKFLLPLYNTYFQFQLPFFFKGDYSEFYDSGSDFKHEKDIKASSFKEPSFRLDHWFEHQMSKDFFHALEISYTPKLYRPSVYQFGNGRHEIKINYHYLNYFDKYFLEGNIYTKVFGRKKLILTDSEIEVTPAYTEVATNLGVGFYNRAWIIAASVTYGQTTDYSNKSKNLTHESDKGFVLNYNLRILRHLSADFDLEAKYSAFSKIFNTINEDTSKDIDFEKETSELELSIYRNF